MIRQLRQRKNDSLGAGKVSPLNSFHFIVQSGMGEGGYKMRGVTGSNKLQSFTAHRPTLRSGCSAEQVRPSPHAALPVSVPAPAPDSSIMKMNNLGGSREVSTHWLPGFWIQLHCVAVGIRGAN